MKRKKLLLFIFNLFLATSWAQTLEETRNIAEIQFQQGDYELAIPNLERIMFFSKDNKNIQAVTIYTLAKSYFFTQNYSQAVYYFDQAYFSLDNDSLKKECVFQKALCLFSENNYQLALLEVLSLNNLQSPYFLNRQNLYLASLYFKTGNLDSSYVYFCKLIKTKEQQKELDRYFKKAYHIQKRKAGLPMLMSLVIPGTGQFYIGDIKNGLNSFILNYALLFAFTYTALNYTVLDASLVFIPWIFRYYLGGVRKVQQTITQRKAVSNKIIYNKILHYVRNK